MVDEKADITDNYNKHSGQTIRCAINVVETVIFVPHTWVRTEVCATED